MVIFRNTIIEYLKRCLSRRNDRSWQGFELSLGLVDILKYLQGKKNASMNVLRNDCPDRGMEWSVSAKT